MKYSTICVQSKQSTNGRLTNDCRVEITTRYWAAGRKTKMAETRILLNAYGGTQSAINKAQTRQQSD